MGIDGCRAGWLVAERHMESAALTLKVVDDDGLRAALQRCALALVDMPIGLPETAPSRPCDTSLRAALSRGRRSSVFNPPVRAVLACGTWDDANATSRVICGAGLSRQSWFLVPKIRVLDQLFSGRQDLQTLVLESHPEWLFERLSGHALAPKKTPVGQLQRLDLLTGWEPPLQQVVPAFLASVKRSAVQPDDVLDALVLLREAEMAVSEGLQTLPEGQLPGPGHYHAARHPCTTNTSVP
jgi:predicted RNase H-like nuclease